MGILLKMAAVIVACCSIRFPLFKAEDFWTDGDVKFIPGNERCRGACGEWRPMPCSCDYKCLVFNSCCSDFETECSRFEDESRHLYEHLIPANVSCMSEVFVITGCLRQAIGDAHVTVDETSGGHSDLSDTNRRREYNLFLEEIPVIDLGTGFSFANLSVLRRCAGNESKTKMWLVLYEQIWVNFSQTASPYVILKQEYFPHTVRHPDTPHETNATHLCVSDSVGTCPEADSRPNLVDKCRRSSFSFVYQDNVFFNNKYCALCNGVNDSFPVNYEYWRSDRGNFELPVVMSISGNKQPKKIQLLNMHRFSSWKLMECVVPESERVSCSVVSCSEETVKRPDGLCKEPCLVILAISTGYSRLSGGLSREHLLFMHCYLTRLRRLDVSDSWNQSVVNNINHFNETFHVFEFLLYEFDDIFIINQTPVTKIDYLQHFRAMVSSIRELMKAADRSITGVDQHPKNEHTGFGDRVCYCTSHDVVHRKWRTNHYAHCEFECADVISQGDKRELHNDISLCSWQLQSGVTDIHVLAVLAPVAILARVVIFHL